MLRELELKPVYDTSEDDLIQELFCPLLKASRLYQRGVGYFTSGWLRIASSGMTDFAERGGKAFLVTSPHLEEQDWDAFKQGNAAKNDELILRSLKRAVVDLETSLQQDTLTALAWLIADGLLTIKIAVPKNHTGDFHDKFAVFEDSNGDRVAIHGSYNDSVHGTLNGESFSVFSSWEDGQQPYVKAHQERFLRLLNDRNDFYEVRDLPKAIEDDIKKLKGNRSRPYTLKPTKYKEPKGITLYDFQEDAIRSWFRAGCVGVLEMATGTGKTITSLAMASRLSAKQDHNLAIVITVPFNHLVDQWKNDAIAFGFSPILCRGSSKGWFAGLRSRVDDFRLGNRQSLMVIATQDTASSRKFTEVLSLVQDKLLLIADEVHYLGAPKLRRALLPNYGFRIGLSATPHRWYDEEGSEAIRSYFSDTVLEYPIERAISGGFLTPYYYYPHAVPLTDAEMDQFSNLTSKMSSLAMHSTDDDARNEALERLARARAKLIATAERKLDTLTRLLTGQLHASGQEGVKHTIIYCAPGETKTVLPILARLGLRAREFVYTVNPKQRVAVLEQFKNGDIQVLVAIKCLDEGVNIPATRRAYFLASTSNPREFIQRRGRILRKSVGKEYAELHDIIVVPPMQWTGNIEHERAVIRREMPRFAEFAGASVNEYQARDAVYSLLKNYDLLDLFDKKPWDVYREQLDREGGQM